MVKMAIQKILILFFLAINASCITSFEPDHIESVSDLLVVDGTITEGETIITLSKSVGLKDKLSKDVYINNAKVYVECDDGINSDLGQLSSDGKYHIQVKDLNQNSKYRLRIDIDNYKYQSAFLSPLFTPEIDSLSWIKKGKGEPVFICVSTHDPKNQSMYYRWTYKEHWEVKAELAANAGYVYVNGQKVVQMFDLGTSNNTYYCWGTDSSKVLYLGSADKIKDNLVYQKRLAEIPPYHDKLSILYYINVEQIMIRKEAYDYLFNLQKNIEETGSLFAPVPSEMKGNIECFSHPNMPVIGYIDVSTIVCKELYIPLKEGLYEPRFSSCLSMITNDSMSDLALYSYVEGGETLYAPLSCVSCLTKDNATKNKPPFWPTDHL